MPPFGPAGSEAPCMCGISTRENREVPRTPVSDGDAGRIGKSKDAIR